MKKIIAICLFTNICQAGNDLIFADGFESSSCVAGTLLFQENFTTANLTPWDGFNQWQITGDGVAFAEINNGQAELIPVSSNTPYSLARMKHSLNAINAEATFSIYFENANTQGVGFYMRSNGGFLDHTNPTGQGYGVFIEKSLTQNNSPGIGLWYELNGTETFIIKDYDVSYEILDETEYRVRFQVIQETASSTRLQARFWQAGSSEPSIWQVSELDSHAILQNLSGGIVVDSYSSQSSGIVSTATRLDNIEVRQLCPIF